MPQKVTFHPPLVLDQRCDRGKHGEDDDVPEKYLHKIPALPLKVGSTGRQRRFDRGAPRAMRCADAHRETRTYKVRSRTYFASRSSRLEMRRIGRFRILVEITH